MSLQLAIIKKVTTATNTATPFDEYENPTPTVNTLVGTPVQSSSSYSISGTNVTVFYSMYQLYKDASNNQYGVFHNGSSNINIADLCTAATPVTVTPTVSATSDMSSNGIKFTISITIDYKKCAETLMQVEMENPV